MKMNNWGALVASLLLMSCFFVVFPVEVKAANACSSSWMGVASKQGWLFNGTDGQSVGYCTTRKPTQQEVDAMYQDCNDTRDGLNQWVSATQDMNCTKLGMEIKTSPQGYKLAYPILKKPTATTTPTLTVTPSGERVVVKNASVNSLLTTKNVALIALVTSLIAILLSVLNLRKGRTKK